MSTAEPNEPGRDAGIDAIQADIERTRGEVGDTVNALTAKLEAKKNAVDKARAAAKPSLAVVASVAGATVIVIVWWRRRSSSGKG